MGCMGTDIPDPSEAVASGIAADLETLPERRRVEAAALRGEKVTINVPGRGPVELDFTGLGEADYQRQFADQMAGELLGIQQEFGPQYIEQRLAELERSDPEGAAMRRRLWGAVQAETADQGAADRPGAEALQELIMGQLEGGASLDPETEKRISQQVLGGQVARGNYLGNAAATEEATALADAGEAQRLQRQQQALDFLVAGVSPEDTAYRRQQQNLTNLGAFVAGETPTAQFAQLSGAQRGAAPYAQLGAPLSGVDPNAAAQGVNFTNNIAASRMAFDASQVNPWTAGLTGAAQGVNVWQASRGGGWGG